LGTIRVLTSPEFKKACAGIAFAPTFREVSTFNSISQLFGLISVIAIIWLAVGAFRRKRILWGLGILFLPIIPAAIYFLYFTAFGPNRYHLYWPFAVGLVTPIAASVYGLKYWIEVKKPFLVYITSFILSAVASYYVFSASGGWAMLRASQDIAQGIAQQNLTEADALKFMHSNLDMVETSGLSEEQQKKMEFMRAFLRKAEGGFTDQEQGDVQKDFRGLMNPCDTSAKNPGIGEQSQGNKQPDSREASLRGTPVVQSDGYTKRGETPALRNEDSTPPVTVIRFPRSGASGKSVASDALAQAKRWIGQFVLVTPMKGVQQHGVLIEVSGNGLRLEKNMVAGTISLPFKDNEIESIQLLK